MPGYVPRSSGPGFHNISDAKGIAAGLTYRPLAKLLKDDLDGFNAFFPKEFEFGLAGCDAGITRKREAEVLVALGR